MPMDNSTMQGVDFLAGYWAFAQWALIVIGVVVLLLAVAMRQPGRAFAVLILGIYATAAWYYMTIYEDLGVDLEWAIAGVIAVGLVVVGTFYYFVFIKTK